jgi:integrase
MPKIEFARVPERLARFVTQEHFALIYTSCDVAEFPDETSYPPAEWWHGLMVMAQMTGWRISELLSLEWDDVDLERGTALTRARDNKGNRDELVALHSVVVDHLKPLQTFHPNVFPWEHYEKKLYDEFARIQDAAGIKLSCHIDRPHDGTPACDRYGFHDERRAFATQNALNMTREALQALMRHKSPLTTQRYISMARQLNPAVANLLVPEILKAADVG